ncbi:MAG: hypothetical protein Q7J27_08930 [Syntrophales bacterium]|nr:hypothetical protein [Syntrophales bacterium]
MEYEKRDKSRTFIYFDEKHLEESGDLKIIGYFSLALKTIKVSVIETMSNNLKKRLGNLSDKDKNLMAYLIGQVGRDSSYDSNVIDGSKMLQDCYKLIASARDIVGGRIILVECKPVDKLCQFYENERYIDITEDDEGLKQYIRFMD